MGWRARTGCVLPRGWPRWLRASAVPAAGCRFASQRTRWGSCSTRGTISLNLCLLFQRPAVLQYLMVHELAHLKHMKSRATLLGAGRALRAAMA